MAEWMRRRFLKASLATVSTSIMLLNLKPRRVFAQSCGGNNVVYDPDDGCLVIADGMCSDGGGGSNCYQGILDGEC